MNQKTWTGDSPVHVFWFCWELKNTPVLFHLDSLASVFWFCWGYHVAPVLFRFLLFHYNFPASVDVHSFGFRTANALTLEGVPFIVGAGFGPLSGELLYC